MPNFLLCKSCTFRNKLVLAQGTTFTLKVNSQFLHSTVSQFLSKQLSSVCRPLTVFQVCGQLLQSASNQRKCMEFLSHSIPSGQISTSLVISGYQSVLQGLSNRLGNTRFSQVSDGNQSLCLCDRDVNSFSRRRGTQLICRTLESSF